MLSMANKLELLQTELETDEDWRAALLDETIRGLSVVDVWPEWAGQCQAMRSRLIRFKLTEGGDDLHLLTANASSNSYLTRFRDHSEPTWMFFAGGQLVNLYIGCSWPHLLNTVRRELRAERRVMAKKGVRKVLPLNEPTPAERQRLEEATARAAAAKQAEKDDADAALRAIRLRQYQAVAEKLPNYTVVLFLPHALEQGQLPQLVESLEASWEAMGIRIVQSTRLAVSPEAADELYWERRLPQHSELVESLKGKHCIALLLRRGRSGAESLSEEEDEGHGADEDSGGRGDAPPLSRREDSAYAVRDDDSAEAISGSGLHDGSLLERLVAETVYGFYPESASTSAVTHSPSRNDSLTEFFSPVNAVGGGVSPAPSITSSATPVIRGEHGGDEEEDEDEHDLAEYGAGHDGSDMTRVSSQLEATWPSELRPVVNSAAAALLHRVSDSGVVVPGVWTPLTPLSKAAAVRVLFDAFALDYYEPEEPPPPPPPATVVCFRAYKRYQVLETAANFLDSVVHLGFYTDDRKLLAETPALYDALPFKGPRDRLVLALTVGVAGPDKPLLELAEFGPIYVSPTARLAEADVEEFFTGDVQQAPLRMAMEAKGRLGSLTSMGSMAATEGFDEAARLAYRTFRYTPKKITNIKKQSVTSASGGLRRVMSLSATRPGQPHPQLSAPHLEGLERSLLTEPPTRPLQPQTRPLQPPTRPLQPQTRPLQPPTRPLQPQTRPLQPPTRPPQSPTKPTTRPPAGLLSELAEPTGPAGPSDSTSVPPRPPTLSSQSVSVTTALGHASELQGVQQNDCPSTAQQSEIPSTGQDRQPSRVSEDASTASVCASMGTTRTLRTTSRTSLRRASPTSSSPNSTVRRNGYQSPQKASISSKQSSGVRIESLRETPVRTSTRPSQSSWVIVEGASSAGSSVTLKAPRQVSRIDLIQSETAQDGQSTHQLERSASFLQSMEQSVPHADSSSDTLALLVNLGKK